MVIKPTAHIHPGLLFGLAAGVSYGLFLAMSRWLAAQHRAGLLLFSQLCFGALVITPWGVAAVPEISPSVLAWVLISAVASGLGNWLLVYVSKYLEAQVIAPLIYLQLVGATGFGYFVFGDWPDALALGGLGVILASGLLLLTLRKPANARHRPSQTNS